MSLEPKLTGLDERVLAALSAGRARRLPDVVAELNRRQRRRCLPEVAAGDVRLILRGFEHLGRVTGRGGWWRVLSEGARDDA